MSALSTLTAWLNRMLDRLTVSQSVFADKGSRWFERGRRTKFGAVAEFKKLRLPMYVMALEDRITPHGPGLAGADMPFGVPEPPDMQVPVPNFSTKTAPQSPYAVYDGSHEANILTIVLDFKEPAQSNTTDIFGNVVGAFDVTAFGFTSMDFNTVAKAIAAEVDQDYFSELVGTVAGPAGQDLKIEFMIGDIGTPPVGVSEFYYVQIGSFVSGPHGSSLGVAGVSVVRNSSGTGPNFGVTSGQVVGSIFTNNINNIGGLTPSNALKSGNLTFTTMAVSGTLSHEIGHTLSLSHIAKAGSTQAVPGTAPIMGTGAIDLPNQDRLTDRSFSISGVDPQQMGSPTVMHVQQLKDAVGLHTIPTSTNSILLNAIGVSYTQNFDTLAVGNSTSTFSSVPIGWSFSETGSNANATYGANNGSSNTGNTYSYGADTSSERAFGGLLSSSLVPTIGANFTNNTGGYINSLSVSFFGEQWRYGAVVGSPRQDRLDFQFSLNATSLTTGTWIDFDELDFKAPNVSGSPRSLDGNLAVNRTLVSATISGLGIANGGTIWIRWSDFNALDADDGLAVDDFTITPNTSATIGLDGSNNLTIIPAAGAANNFAVKVNGNNYLITGADASNSFFSSIPAASGHDTSVLVWINSVTGTQILVNGNDGNDKLTVDFNGGQFPHAITFDGGTGADSMAVIGTGTTYQRHIYNYANATDGNIEFDTDGSGPIDYTLSYVNLAPLSNDGTPADIVFNMPAAATALLDDDGTPMNGMSRLASTDFESTDFANPTNSVTINGLGATLSINSPVDFKRHLMIGSSGSRVGIINFNGTLTLDADRHLTGFASSSITFSGSGQVEAQGTGTIGLDTARTVMMATGASLQSANGAITLSANTAGTSVGTFHGLDMDGAVIQITGSGLLSITARGGNTSTGNQGVRVFNGSVIRGGTTGTTTIAGIGGGSSGSDNHGVFVTTSSSLISTNGGQLEITGTEGVGSTGIQTLSTGLISTANNGGDVTLIANNVALSTPVSVSTQAAGMVTIRPRTAGVGINIGGGDVIGGPIGMATAEFGRIATGTLRLGDTATGAVSVTAAVTTGLNYHLEVISGSSVTVNQAITMAGNKNLTMTAVATINLATATADLTVSGTGSVSISTTRDIVMSSGSSVTAANGNLTLSANASGTGNGSFAGIELTNAQVIITGSGVLEVTGRGGTSGLNPFGVSLSSGAVIQGGTTGTASVTGTGGTSTSSGNAGVRVVGANSRITTLGANLEVKGTGGGAGAQNANHGIIVQSSGLITAGGAGTVSIEGIGGTTSNFNHGVLVDGGTISSINGNVALKGTGGGQVGGGGDNRGVYVLSGGLITAGGASSVDVEGTGGLNNAGSANHGVHVAGVNSKITSAGGAISVMATAGALATGIQVDASGLITTATNGGNITLTADAIELLATTSISATGSDTVTIRPKTNGTQINLGGADGNGTLGLTDPELDRVMAGTLVIGHANSGHLTVSAAIDRPAMTNVELRSGGDVVLQNNFDTGGGTMLLSPGAAFAVKPKAGPGIDEITASTVSFNTNFAVLLEGTTENTEYDQLSVNGVVNLTNVVLVLPLSLIILSAGNTFKIVKAKGRIGTLSNLPINGDTISFQGKKLAVSYDANDVTLTVVPEGTMTAAIVGNDLVITDIDGKNNNWSIQYTGTQFVISDATEQFDSAPGNGMLSNGNKTLTIPATDFSGQVIFQGGNGNDLLLVDWALANQARDIDFIGGAGNDQLVVTGGTFTSATMTFTNANDGHLVMDPTGTDPARNITYTGLEPIDMTGSTVDDLVFNLPMTASNAFLEDDGTSGNSISRIRSSPINFETTDFSNPTNSLTINRGHASDSITVSALPDFNRTLIIGASTAPFGPVTVTGAATLASGYNFAVFASGTISFPNATSDWATTGSGSIGLTTARNIALGNGSSIITADGAVVLSANQQMSPTSGDFVGVDVNFAIVRATGLGAVAVAGRGGDASGGNQFGVYVRNAGLIQGGTGALASVVGQGGASSGSTNYGVYVTGFNSKIISSGSNVQVSGAGGGSGASASSYGIFLNSSALVSAGGTGTVTATGIGGLGTGANNYGISINSGSTVSTNDGDVTIFGTAGTGATAIGVVMVLGGIINAGGSGDVYFHADSASITSGAVSALGDTVTFQPLTAGVSIDLGNSTDIPFGSLRLSGAEINVISASQLVIGSSMGGNILVSSPITRTSAINVELITNGDITFITGFDTAGGTMKLHTLTGSIKPQAGIGFSEVTASTVSFGSDVSITINGKTANVNHDQLKVSGAVDLTNAVLKLGGSYTFVSSDTLTIVAADTITNTFTGLPNGATLSFGMQTVQINYSATAVTLTLFVGVSATLSAVIVGNDLVITDTHGGKHNNLSLQFNGASFVISDANEAFISAPLGGVLTDSNKTLTIPATAFSGRVIVHGVGGNDLLHIDESLGGIPRAIDFHGGTGLDTLSYAGAATALSVALTSVSDADGYHGSVGGLAGNFTGVNNIGGGSGNDKLFGRSVGSKWTIDTTNSYQDDGLGNLTFASFEELRGGAANDRFVFQNNVLFAGVIDGGVGYDTLIFSDASNTVGVTVNFTGFNAGHVNSISHSFINVENFAGTGADDTFAFAVHGINIAGRLDGGPGVDTLSYAAFTSQVRANLTTGAATAVASGLVPNSFENLFGGSGNDILVGSAANNLLMSNGGHDVLLGGAGDDTLVGGAGNDILIGGIGADTLQGDAGDDIFIGGSTIYDAAALVSNNYTAFVALMAEWSRTSVPVATRWARINGTATGGLNGSYVLNTTTVSDDGATDTLVDYDGGIVDRTVPS